MARFFYVVQANHPFVQVMRTEEFVFGPRAVSGVCLLSHLQDCKHMYAHPLAIGQDRQLHAYALNWI